MYWDQVLFCIMHNAWEIQTECELINTLKILKQHKIYLLFRLVLILARSLWAKGRSPFFTARRRSCSLPMALIRQKRSNRRSHSHDPLYLENNGVHHIIFTSMANMEIYHISFFCDTRGVVLRSYSTWSTCLFLSASHLHKPHHRGYLGEQQIYYQHNNPVNRYLVL